LGAYHGLETVSQLIGFDFDTQLYSVMHDSVVIWTAPLPHRGLLIDTARPLALVDYIRRVIDSVTYAKLNVIHWHMWTRRPRLRLSTFPRLGKYGA